VLVDHVTISESDITWRAVRSSGPGGQNVNKVSTKIELRFDLAGTGSLGPEVKERLRHIAREKTRTREQNLSDARAKLADLIRRALTPPKPRHPTKPTRSSKRKRLEAKRRHSVRKQSRRVTDD
jgi:ribosome-associated protein